MLKLCPVVYIFLPLSYMPAVLYTFSYASVYSRPPRDDLEGPSSISYQQRKNAFFGNPKSSVAFSESIFHANDTEG